MYDVVCMRSSNLIYIIRIYVCVELSSNAVVFLQCVSPGNPSVDADSAGKAPSAGLFDSGVDPGTLTPNQPCSFIATGTLKHKSIASLNYVIDNKVTGYST